MSENTLTIAKAENSSGIQQQVLDRSTFARDLSSIGIVSGDTVFLQSDMSSFAKMSGNPLSTFVSAFFDVVGESGTLIVPAYTRAGFVWDRETAVFCLNSRPITGALPNYLLRQDKSIRSSHPTHSMIAIGCKAEELLKGHDMHSRAFYPIERLGEIEGKQMLMGCAASTPGFPSVHAAQGMLGLSQRHWMRLLLRVKISLESGISTHTPKESPGCSRNFGSLYAGYISDSNLITGYVGNAWSVLSDVKKALATDVQYLSEDPRFVCCNRWSCTSCRLLRGYNKRAIPLAIASKLVSPLMKKLKK